SRRGVLTREDFRREFLLLERFFRSAAGGVAYGSPGKLCCLCHLERSSLDDLLLLRQRWKEIHIVAPSYCWVYWDNSTSRHRNFGPIMGRLKRQSTARRQQPTGARAGRF